MFIDLNFSSAVPNFLTLLMNTDLDFSSSNTTFIGLKMTSVGKESGENEGQEVGQRTGNICK
jgi:hypothetical protein